MAATTIKDDNNYSFVTDRKNPKSLQVLKTTTATPKSNDDDNDDGLVFEIIQTSLSANNKFYVDFGDKQPFSFFKCYPVDIEKSTLLLLDDNNNNNTNKEDLVHPPVWGVCKVIQSKIDDVKVGTYYFAQLPMAERCSFKGGTVNKEDGSLTIERDNTNPAYNVFNKINETDSTYLSKDLGGLAIACFPGIITGFGLYHQLEEKNYYESDTIVLTSASSKVSLALALYLKQEKSGKKVIGYTSDSNKEFCEQTGLYDVILGYDDVLSEDDTNKCVMIDVSGKGNVYKNNVSKVVKLLCVGNSSATSDDKSTVSTFSYYATIKMILMMIGIVPSWIRNLMNPTQEFFLIVDIVAKLKSEWGIEKYKLTMESFTKTFCENAKTNWGMSIRSCTTETSIIQGYEDIMEGTVPPTEAIVLDVTKAVACHHK